mmetsp:Transcript_176062/g.564532  ORF Transcript_176062/g.564532 Transcript_176062/m.564532 type:complete len:124 (+) Transcript_176062:870-1241(+)
MQLLDREMLHSIANEAIATISEAMTKDLASMAWAFARLAVPNPKLMDAIAAQSLPISCSSFDAEDLANTAWAFAKVTVRNKPLLESISKAANSRWRACCQDLSHLPSLPPTRHRCNRICCKIH